MTIYVVIDHEYEHCEVIAAYNTREEADAFVADWPMDGYDVEECESLSSGLPTMYDVHWDADDDKVPRIARVSRHNYIKGSTPLRLERQWGFRYNRDELRLIGRVLGTVDEVNAQVRQARAWMDAHADAILDWRGRTRKFDEPFPSNESNEWVIPLDNQN